MTDKEHQAELNRDANIERAKRNRKKNNRMHNRMARVSRKRNR